MLRVVYFLHSEVQCILHCLNVYLKKCRNQYVRLQNIFKYLHEKLCYVMHFVQGMTLNINCYKKGTLEKYITSEDVSRQFTFCPTTWNFTCTRTLPNQ